MTDRTPPPLPRHPPHPSRPAHEHLWWPVNTDLVCGYNGEFVGFKVTWACECGAFRTTDQREQRNA